MQLMDREPNFLPSRKRIEHIESMRMQSEILQFALCHLFHSFPADLVPPWLLSGNTYAKVLIRATYCDNSSRPDR